jgi:hypothetical protein
MSRLYLGDSVWVEALRKRFGIDKPKWAGWGEWDEINTRIRQEHPVGWFFTETVPDFIEAVHDFITAPYYNTRYYIRNRFIRKTHQLRTDCPVGEYWDTDERLTTAMANAIIDYVEIELALKSAWCRSEESKTAVWHNGRCAELGLEYLAWEQTLDDESLDENSRSDHQANSARQIAEIYNWAKHRNSRPDPHDASGWTEYCAKYPRSWTLKPEDVTPEQAAEADAALDKCREIEKQYEQEDHDMLISIVKIRKSLWT